MAFDANMSDLACGSTFTAVIHSLSESSLLHRSGFRAGDKIQCEKNESGVNSVIHVNAPFNLSGAPWVAIKSTTCTTIELIVFDKLITTASEGVKSNNARFTIDQLRLAAAISKEIDNQQGDLSVPAQQDFMTACLEGALFVQNKLRGVEFTPVTTEGKVK